jgi:YD repeat-containing protein
MKTMKETNPGAPTRRTGRPVAPCLAAVLSLVLLLGACGKSDEPARQAAPAAAIAAAKPAPRAAAPTRPEDTLPAPRCPSKAGAQLPGPDIVGLKLGMSFDEALEHARCAMPDGVVGVSNRWFQQMRTGSTQLQNQGFTVQRGETSACDYRKIGEAQKCGLGRLVWDHIAELISVASPGVDGRQLVIGIWRQQHWKPGEMPAREAVLAALRDKYGREGELTDQPYGTVSWRYDAAGRPLARRDPLFQECAGIRARPGSQFWREGCGLSISADLVSARDNPQLVQSLYVGIAHQERLLAVGDAMQAELDRLDAERRAAEVQRASGAKPRL